MSALTIVKSKDVDSLPKMKALIYGHPGVGKTTLAATGGGKTLIIDTENGSNFLGSAGVDVDIVHISSFLEMTEAVEMAQSYDTVVIDSIGELLDKLLQKLKKSGYGANGGETLNIQGWGVAKDKFKSLIRQFRDMDCNLVLIAHTTAKKNDDRLIVRPKLQASLDEDVCGMMHLVGYLTTMKDEKTGQSQRVLYTQPNDRYYAKERIGVLPDTIDNPSIGSIIKLVSESPRFQATAKMEKKETEQKKKFEDELEQSSQ